MYARSTTILGDPGAIDAGVAHVRDKVLPVLTDTEGCVGLSLLVDREHGRSLVATAWTDQEALRASADRVRPVRNRLVHVLGGQDAEVREWEIAVLHREHPAGDGARAQVAWARTQPNHVDGLLDAFRASLMPRLQELPGFCSLSLVVDRRNGRTASVTAFDSREALETVRKEARSLREQFAQAVGARLVDVAEMDLVLAHLRVPETA